MYTGVLCVSVCGGVCVVWCGVCGVCGLFGVCNVGVCNVGV